MIIESIYIENIKNFGNKGFVLNFSEHSGINTVSGMNGSGKTAAFQAIQLFQKLFFFEQLDEETQYDVYDKIKSLAQQLMTSIESVIDIFFKVGNQQANVRLLLTLEGEIFDYVFTTPVEYQNSIELVKEHWNFEQPTSLIVFIDAGKSFSDFGVSFDNITLKSREKNDEDFIIDCIFRPDEILKSIYKRTVLDHIHYRLDPSRRYLYFKAANDATKKIAPNIEVKNISATKRDGELVILGRTTTGAQLFDIKDFSTGERSLYLTILFLFYFPNVGTLIIDEPENHFHEKFLSNFYLFLKELIEDGGAYQWLNKNFNTDNDYKQLSCSGLKKIFLITHSKSLIYQNMNFGDCFIFSNNEFRKIHNTYIEKELRGCGISSVFSRTLFVEGESDTEIFTPILNLNRINVVSVSDCHEVIERFKKVSEMKHALHDATFCFVMDRDNKSDQEITQIRNIDPEFYDESFILLRKHEIENYMIDLKLIQDVINPILEQLFMQKLTKNDITSIFESESEKLKTQSYHKFLSSHLRSHTREKISDPLSNIKNIKTKSVDELVSHVITDDFKTQLTKHINHLESLFENEWNSKWQEYVDGKAFIRSVMKKISERSAGIKSDIIIKAMIKTIQSSPNDYMLGQLIEEILNKFKNQDFHLQ